MVPRSFKKFGKRLIRSMSGYFGRQSLIGDPPVFDSSIFPFTAEFEANWRKYVEDYLK